MREDDRDQVVALVHQSFNQPPAYVERTRTVPVEDVRVVADEGRVVASAVLRDFAYFFGGRSVPTAGVSGVAVAPETRGRRTAEMLVGEILREARDAAPLSALYPATVPLYRRLGYEFAAPRYRYRAAIDDLPRVRSALAVEPWDDASIPDVARAYRAYAADYNGMMDRRDDLWASRILKPFGDDRIFRYLVREGGEVAGSIVYKQEKDFHFDIECRDLFWRTPGAGRALLGFVAGHHSLGERVFWYGSPFDLWAFPTVEEDIKVDERHHLMLRILDVPAAIAARGYDEIAEADVTVRFDDALFPDNAGPWRIAVAGGKGSAEPADDAAAVAGIGAFAAVYSGLVSASEARRAGLLEASDGAVGALDRIFAGPAPFTTDFF